MSAADDVSEAFLLPHDQRVTIDYTNWKGHRRLRVILPLMSTLRFVVTPHHTPAQWVFDAHDMEQPDHPRRTFALRDIRAWEPAP